MTREEVLGAAEADGGWEKEKEALAVPIPPRAALLAVATLKAVAQYTPLTKPQEEAVELPLTLGEKGPVAL